MKHLILLTSLITTPALALEGWVDVHIGSLHKETEIDVNGQHYSINQVNPGIGLTLPAKDYMDYKVGVYRNSYEKAAFYLGVDPHTSSSRPIILGVMLGVVSGYEQTNGNTIIGAVVPHITYIIHKKIKVDLSYLHGKHAKAIALSVGFKFDM